jgi:hypothetical protein
MTSFQNEFRLETSLTLPGRSLDTVFKFFSTASNLDAITPEFLAFRILTSHDIKMEVGAVIDYKLKIHGVPIYWKSLISCWDPPYCFVDEQLRGPCRYWIHKHEFEENEFGTVVRDVVRYQVFGGKLFHNLFVKRDVQSIFEYRQRKLLEIL